MAAPIASLDAELPPKALVAERDGTFRGVEQFYQRGRLYADRPSPDQASRSDSSTLLKISAAMFATVEHARRSSMSNELLLIWLVVGAIAGWLAGTIVKGGGFGLLGDIVIGIIGAFVGGWLLTQLGVTIGTGIVSVIATATIGAVALLALLRVVRFA
jgi:uncharacterized membrane protein YeaQ/YmgE (transglycosylase-associated protein family)